MKSTTIKRRATLIGAFLGIVAAVGIVAYAITSFFATGTPFSINPDRPDIVEIRDSNPFPETAGMKPGDSMSFSPSITSHSTVDLYVFGPMSRFSTK